MTPIDDINIGDTIAVVGCKIRKIHDFTGIPQTVVGISLPFLAIDDGSELRTLDVRVWEVKKLGQHYVNVVRDDVQTPVKRRKQQKQQQQQDPMQCRNCGDQFCERLVGRVWRWWCRNCHTDGGPADKAPSY